MRVELAHPVAQRVLELARITHRAHINDHAADVGNFGRRKIGLRRGRLPQTSIFPVRNHTDDFRVRCDCPHVVHEPKALPDRIAAGEILLDKGFIHDRVIGWGNISRGKCAAGDDRNPKRPKVVRVHVTKNRLLFNWRSFEVLAQNRILPCKASQDRHSRESHRRNAGHGFQVEA